MPHRIQLENDKGQLTHDFFTEDDFKPDDKALEDIQQEFSWEQTLKDLGNKIKGDPVGLMKDVGNEALGEFGLANADWSKALPDFSQIGQGIAKATSATNPHLFSGLSDIYHGLMRPVGSGKELVDTAVGLATGDKDTSLLGNEAGQALWEEAKRQVGAEGTKQPFIDTLGRGAMGMLSDPITAAIPTEAGMAFAPGMAEGVYQGLQKSGLAKRIMGQENFTAPYEFNPEQQAGLAEAIISGGGLALAGSHYAPKVKEALGNFNIEAPRLDPEAGVLSHGRYQRPGETAPVDPTLSNRALDAFPARSKEMIQNESIQDLFDLLRRAEDIDNRHREIADPATAGQSQLSSFSFDPSGPRGGNLEGDIRLDPAAIAKRAPDLESFLQQAVKTSGHEAGHQEEGGIARRHGITDPSVADFNREELPSGNLAEFADESYTDREGNYLADPTNKDFAFQTGLESVRNRTASPLDDMINEYMSNPNDRATLENAFRISKGERGPRADYKDFIPEEDVSLERLKISLSLFLLRLIMVLLKNLIN